MASKGAAAMTATTQDRPYLLGHEARELERLRRQADFYAPLTDQALRLAGIAPGMRVLDAGCGAGDVSVQLARLIGPTGEVIAVDRAPDAVATARSRFDDAGIENIHLLEGDVATVELDAPVDAIVGRMILMHVSDPVAVLRNLRRSLHSPGVLLFQELDIGVARAEPPAPLVDEMIELCRQTFQRVGIDPRPGLRLHEQFVQAGLPAPNLVSLGRIEAAPAAASCAMLASVLTTLLPAIEATGLGSADSLQLATLPERLQREVRATGSLVFTPSLIAAWSRLD
jgi:SAM-dependent methyltransferase